MVKSKQEVTYEKLKTLRNNNSLVPGTYYRITDYVATTKQGNTGVIQNNFDIIVLALESNNLSENAFAARHKGDTYFQYNNLSVWKLKYTLDNDTNKYGWADNTNGKGVIYRLIDLLASMCTIMKKPMKPLRWLTLINTTSR